MTTPLGAFGPPPDAVAWGALLVAVLWLALSSSHRLSRTFTSPETTRRYRLVIGALALSAAALSAIYVAHYLRGGPRIVDATTYFLQGRALAEGHVRFPVPSPSGSFRGRFLLTTDDGRTLSGIFPPGYPAYLAVFFRLGVPMLGGPVLAATLVLLSTALARRLSEDTRVAVLAAGLSAVCGVLRYHTADTMSHGLAAALATTALLASLTDRRWTPVVAGISLSALVATRPVSGVVVLVVSLFAVSGWPRRALLLLAAAPGVAVFVALQSVASGHVFSSTQRAYYALADSPVDCFRYGFGRGIGCLFEHGDFVAARLPHGYGILEALGTTLRRVKMHLADAGNAEPFFVALVCALGGAFRRPRERALAATIIGVVVGYAPFYFDGNYPGGGARFFADVLPLEHVLLATWLVRRGAVRWTIPAALVGFALHTSYDHVKLRDREGGRPMFEPGALDAAGVTRGLVFVDTDHGFSLGFDPDADPTRSVLVARRRRDAHDALLWDRMGRPPAYAYDFDPRRSDSSPRVASLSLSVPDVARFEAEAEWPPLAVSNGTVLPGFHPAASGGRTLRFLPAGGPGSVRLALLSPHPGAYRILLGFLAGTEPVRVGVRVGARSAALKGPDGVVDGAPIRLEGPSVDMSEGSDIIEISSETTLSVDYVELVPIP